MIQRASFPSAGLLALVFFVFWVYWMAQHVTHVTAIEPRGTRYAAASIWYLFKVSSTGRMGHVLRMVLARQHQFFSDIPTLSHVIDDPLPQCALSFQKTDVTDTEKPFLSARQCYANTVFYLKEADFAFLVTSNE